MQAAPHSRFRPACALRSSVATACTMQRRWRLGRGSTTAGACRLGAAGRVQTLAPRPCRVSEHAIWAAIVGVRSIPGSLENVDWMEKLWVWAGRGRFSGVGLVDARQAQRSVAARVRLSPVLSFSTHNMDGLCNSAGSSKLVWLLNGARAQSASSPLRRCGRAWAAAAGGVNVEGNGLALVLLVNRLCDPRCQAAPGRRWEAGWCRVRALGALPAL